MIAEIPCGTVVVGMITTFLSSTKDCACVAARMIFLLFGALFAKEIDCTTVIPTHYDMMRGNEENPLLFAYYMEHTQPNRAWHILRNGEPYLYTQ